MRSEGRIRLTLAEGNLHKAFTFDGSLQNIGCDMVLEISAHCGEDRVCCGNGLKTGDSNIGNGMSVVFPFHGRGQMV